MSTIILAFLSVSLIATTAQAAHYSATVSSYSALTASITSYKNGYPSLYQSGEIVINGSFSVPAAGIHLDYINNLTLRGYTTGSNRLTASKPRLTATSDHAAYSSVLTVGPRANGITVEDLEIVVSRGVTNKSTRGVSVLSPSTETSDSLRTQDVLLRNLVILPPTGSTSDTVGIQVHNARRIAVNHTDISGLDGIALLMRRVKHIEISHNKIHDLLANTPGIIIDGTGAPIPPATAGTETTPYSAFFESENGNIFRNYLTNVPGQGIFVEGKYFLIDENRLDRIALGSVGGRGIYVKGEDFRVAGNYLTKIDDQGSGGGINAGSCCTSRVFIEGNRLERAGKTNSGGSDSWNGFGVSIRQETIVENNEIIDSGSHGILIQPDASDLLINENTVDGSYRSNIHVSAGFTYNGRYLHREPFGPARDVIIRDNRLYSARDYGIEVVPRSRNEMLNAAISTVLSGYVGNCGYVWQNDGQASFCGTSAYTPYAMWPSNAYWNVYEVTMINNSLWYNQDGGIKLENPGAASWPSVGSGGGCSEFPYNWDNPSYYISYLTSAYNGQGSNYCSVPKPAGAVPTAIPGNQVVDCTDVDGLRGDLAGLSFWSTTQFGSSVADHPEYYPDLTNPRQISRVLPWLSCTGTVSYPTSKCP